MVGAIAIALLAVALAPESQAAASTSPAATTAPVVPAAPDLQYGEYLFWRHCVACHGARGWGNGVVEIPAIAGQRPPYVLEQLARFRSGERPGSDLHGPAMRETLQPDDVEWPPGVRDLVAYLSEATPDPHPDYGDGDALALGKRVYERGCAECHGDGLGSDSLVMPRIAGQHYHYLLVRLRDFAAVHRPLAARLPSASANLSPAEQQAVADYLARLPITSTAGH